MKKIIIVIISTLFLFVGSLYAEETDDQRIAREKKEAINSYLGDNTIPRAEYRRESEDYETLHTIDELNKKDQYDKLLKFQIILQQKKRKMEI